jgi:VIT1/CCC1 family predicted Fe2+/Mn2+ transporter
VPVRHAIVIAAIIVAGVLAYTISKSSDGNPARILQEPLYVFVGVLIVGFA